jgi:hypothetical protein
MGAGVEASARMAVALRLHIPRHVPVHGGLPPHNPSGDGPQNEPDEDTEDVVPPSRGQTRVMIAALYARKSTEQGAGW